MGRRKRRANRIIKRTLPKVFTCPRCGMGSVRVNVEDEETTVTCGSCNLNNSYSKLKKEHVDIYNQFVDDYMQGKVESS